MSIIITITVLIFTQVPLTQKRFERELVWIENTDKMTNSNEIKRLGAGRMWLWNDARKHYLKMDVVSKIIGSGGSFGSHNQYIAWLLRNGVIGLTVWLFFLYKMGYFLWFKSKENRADLTLTFVFVMFWVVTGIMNVFMQPWDNTTFSYFFWASVGLVVLESKTGGGDS
ncbi:hypothetical protein F9K33_13375 [bacterium]|nr:MAG: hypothetical protein F9K33_13375 [bacterium]